MNIGNITIRPTFEVTAPAVDKALTSPATAAPQTTSLTELLATGKDFRAMSKEVMGALREQLPEQTKELAACRKNHQELAGALEKEGWQALKKDPANRPALEKFRGEAVDLVVKLALATMKSMGFDPPGSHSATGTPGWNSDVDTVFMAPPGMPEKVQVAEKLLFDMIFLETFNGLPGDLFDTESYLNHTGAAFDTAKQMGTPEGKEGFARLDLNAASLQMLRQCGGVESKEWQTHKEAQLDNAGSKELKQALIDTFADVEHLERDVSEGIEDVMKNDPSQTKKIATMSYKSAGLFKVSEQMDICKTKIKELDEKIVKEGKATPAQTKAQEGLHLRLGTLGLLRTSFFDEGYNTQGSFIKICFRKEGQIHQRAVESFRKSVIETRRMSLTPINEAIKVEKRFSVGDAQLMKADAQQNASSALENLAMYKGHFAHKAGQGTLSDLQSAMIATSKYSERTLESLDALLNEITTKRPDVSKGDDFQLLKKETTSLLFQAGEEEKVKRSNTLNSTTTKKLLLEVLAPGKNGDASAINQLEKDIDAMLKKTD